MELEVFCDGGALNNPGPGAIGVVIESEGKVIKEVSKFIGFTTNNQAEYKAVIEALNQAQAFNPDRIIINLDSQLVVRQLNGEYKLRNAGLKPLWEKVMNLKSKLDVVEFKYIPRKENKKADCLVKEALKGLKA